MARRRVVVYHMHEHEQAVSRAVMPLGDETESYRIGEVDDSQIPGLREQGLVVQVLDDPPREALRARAESEPATSPRGVRRGARRPPSSRASNFYEVQLAGPLLAPWRAALEAAGGSIREARPGMRVRVRVDPEDLARVQALSFVRSLTMEGSEAALPTAEDLAGVAAGAEALQMVAYDVLLEAAEHLAPFQSWLHERRVAVAAAQGRKVRVFLLEDSPLLDEISALTEWVMSIEPHVVPELHNDVARQILGLDPPGNPGSPALPFTGAGQVVAVADTGLDADHPDFAGRIDARIPLGRPADASDPHGHGTHVAGSVLGDGSASGGRLRGVAPKARLYFQSLLDARGRLDGLPFDLANLFGPAYDAGARIHNNSWGAATRSAYRLSSVEVDTFVHGHKDMLIVISAGNEGSAADPEIGARNADRGFVDWLSIGSPATSKNALTVGASRSRRTSGGFSTRTYGSAWPTDFPDPPIRDQSISGDEQALAAFSSRGPCDDYRVKPDLVAPGTDVISCRSQAAPARTFWGLDPLNQHYAYLGGTSMAAPLVSGCAALVREYYTGKRGHQPSAALLKATLVNSTRWLGAPDAVAAPAGVPNYHQGFGCVHLPDAVPHPDHPAFRLEFVDNWQVPADHFTASGARRRFRFTLAASGELRLCLAYTDPPGRSLQNNLNLLLEVPGTAVKRFGNEQLPRGFNGPDTTNNVEVLRIPGAPAGAYLVQIVAQNLLSPQDFALVVSGPLGSGLVPV